MRLFFSQPDSGLLVAVIACGVGAGLVLVGLVLFVLRQRLAQRTDTGDDAAKTGETERIYREVDRSSFVEDLKWRLADLFQIRSRRNERAR